MGIEGQFAGLTVRTRRQPALAGDGSGKGYLHDIRRFAMLERDQEYELAKRWREHGDRDAANQLVTSHLRLAVKIAMGYRGYGLPISEIISEGNVGLMQALNRFEPEKGFRFATYAMWWIRASIQDYILRSWSLVKIGTTANQKKLFFKLRSAKSKIAAFESGDLHPDQVALIAKSLDVTSAGCRRHESAARRRQIDQCADVMMTLKPANGRTVSSISRLRRKPSSSNRTTRSTGTRH